MKKSQNVNQCTNCGNFIDTKQDTSSQRTSCCKCGGILRNHLVNVNEKIRILDGYEAKGKRAGKKKPFFEDMAKPDYSDHKKKLVHKQRLIDRENNNYRENITDYETGESIHACEEPLSEHFGHGSAKSAKKCTK
jgi:transcription initiation factor TFIIIB Brf1 subunit/transcription initiation factor TFIIB